MFEPSTYVKARCEGCKYRKRVNAQNNYSFYGCYHPPYTGKRVTEVKDCPKKLESEVQNRNEGNTGNGYARMLR